MNARSDIQTLYQRRQLPLPTFHTVLVGGQPHEPEFQCHITTVDQKNVAGPTANSKRNAIAAAAIAWLRTWTKNPESSKLITPSFSQSQARTANPPIEQQDALSFNLPPEDVYGMSFLLFFFFCVH